MNPTARKPRRIATRNGKPAWMDAPPRTRASQSRITAPPMVQQPSLIERLLGRVGL